MLTKLPKLNYLKCLLGPVHGVHPWTVSLAGSRSVRESSEGTEDTYTGIDIEAPVSVWEN